MKEEPLPKEVPKPFTVPEGWKPPTMGEQWAYVCSQQTMSPMTHMSSPQFAVKDMFFLILVFPSVVNVHALRPLKCTFI
jgi:hypothetical protein